MLLTVTNTNCAFQLFSGKLYFCELEWEEGKPFGKKLWLWQNVCVPLKKSKVHEWSAPLLGIFPISYNRILNSYAAYIRVSAWCAILIEFDSVYQLNWPFWKYRIFFCFNIFFFLGQLNKKLTPTWLQSLLWLLRSYLLVQHKHSVHKRNSNNMNRIKATAQKSIGIL